MTSPDYVVVIPTIGRPCLQDCLDSLAIAVTGTGGPAQVVIADDRRDTAGPLPVSPPAELAGRTIVVPLEGRGPATARNAGWRAATAAEWIVFLDDDIRVSPGWGADVAADLADAAPEVGGVQGVISVPWPAEPTGPALPGGVRPADSQRATLGLAGARWITADMAYRRAALTDAGGFDERFPRAYREDSDLALRVMDLGWQLRRGRRHTTHPVPAARHWASLAAQRGNADDAAMRRLHGPRWRQRAGAARGRRRFHVTACAAGGAAIALTAAGALASAAGAPAGTPARRRHDAMLAAGRMAAAGWMALTAEFAIRRILAGPRTPAEMAAMIATSAVIPPLATAHWLAGWRRFRDARPWPPRPAAVLFDRDGTLIRDVPYNHDPSLVEPMPGAAGAVAALRRAGIRVGVASNQSGIGRGLITPEQADAVNAAADKLTGPFGTWQICPHRPEDGCSCRKPAAGMIISAADALGVAAADCVVIGDIGADVAAARAAGARAVLVPTAATLPAERAGVPCAATITEAVDAILAGRLIPSWEGR
jgi:histidinol-phosphate phosphatase family protein